MRGTAIEKDAEVAAPLTNANRARIAGEDVVLDPGGVMIWPEQEMLIVADLHLEKGSAHAERRIFLPPYDTAATLAVLARAVMQYAPRAVVCLGDSFHDRRAETRLCDADRDSILALQAGRDWFWISGNHDPVAPAALGGRACDELALGPFTFRHEPRDEATEGEIAGHLHPAGKVRRRGRSVRRRCFATNGRRLVLPAFGAFTGGLNVLDEAWQNIFSGRRFTAHLLGEDRVYPILGRNLLRD